jgi:L-ascorbate metabolism protein UlaG (beta-lactamase superfamily)
MTNLAAVTSDKLDDFLAQKSDGVFYISHASILVRLSQRLFLFDPVLAKPPHLGSWIFFPEMILDKRLLEVDAVFISHQHQDHFDIDFLKQLPRSTPLYIVGNRPQFSRLFEQAGLSVNEIPPNKTITIFKDISLFGIEHEYNNIDAALLITNGAFSVYHGNDCFVSDARLDLVKAEFPVIDVACVPFAYVHWYPFLLDNVDEAWKASEAQRLIRKYLDYGLSHVARLEPKLAIPFGANMFYFDSVDSDHNKAVLTPFDFKDHAHATSFEWAESIVPLFAGDYAYKHDGDAESLDIRQAPLTPAALKAALHRFIEKRRAEGSGLDFSYLQNVSGSPDCDLTFINERLSVQDEKLAHMLYISNADAADGYIEIDLQTASARFQPHLDERQPYHHFKLTDLAFRAYMSRTFTFNEIVASSRFRLVRSPNEYSLPVLHVVNNIL